MSKPNLVPVIVVTILAIGGGFGGGYALRRANSDAPVSVGGEQVAIQQVATDEKSIKAGDVFGSTDENAFKDHATGYLAESDNEEISPFRLLRPGGKTQTVYLTSTVTDLSKLVGMEVEIWGETADAAGAGWYMDVGRIKVTAVEGISPEADTKK